MSLRPQMIIKDTMMTLRRNRNLLPASSLFLYVHIFLINILIANSYLSQSQAARFGINIEVYE
jgi:hypothetical protein